MQGWSARILSCYSKHDMASRLLDRTLTIVVTATLTSAAWIVAGGSLMELSGSRGQLDTTRPADAAPSPVPLENAFPSLETSDLGNSRPLTPGLNSQSASPMDMAQGKDMMIPVLNIRAGDLTDTFSDSRGAGQRLHEAIDIMAPEGTSVVAAGPGTVEKLFISNAGGKTIYVRSDDKLTIHYYAHLADYAEGLKEGQRVRRGQRLGSVGITGNAAPDSPHLHFSILRTTKDAAWWEPANAVNPYPIFAGK